MSPGEGPGPRVEEPSAGAAPEGAAREGPSAEDEVVAAEDQPAASEAAEDPKPEDSLVEETPSEYQEFTAPLNAAEDRQRAAAAETDRADQTAESTYGADLKAARERMDVTQADVAASLHLEKSVIQAMEAGAEDGLPARVYVRGYIRAYANLVGLDADRLIVKFDAAHGAPEATPRPLIAVGAKRDSRPNLLHRRTGLFLGAIVAAIVVMLAVVLWGVWRAFDWSFVTEAGGVAPPPPAWRSEQTEREGGETAAADTPSAENAKTDARPDAPAVDASASAAPASDVAELVFTFKEDSWVEVRDRTAKVYAELGKAEQSVSVFGQPPFTIAIGYAPGVELRYQGEVVALAPHTQGGVANLMVH